MPYLMLVVGLLIGLYALMRFFQRAQPQQVVSLLQAVFSILLLGGCLLLAVTGRIGPAVAIAGALIPMFAHFAFAKKKKAGQVGGNEDASQNEMGGKVKAGSTIASRAEALDILGLEDNASEEDILKSYKSLMKKLHPDQGGSDYLAQKLTEARDYLIK